MKQSLLILFLFCSTQSHALSVFVGGGIDHLQGLAQTPKGGQPGTTTIDRPTFREAGIDHSTWWEAGVEINVGNYFLTMQYSALHAQGSKPLPASLITHDQFIPKDEDFHLQADYKWYSAGIGKNFGLWQWIITPLLEAHWLHYKYAFQADSAQSSRDFTLLAGTAAVLLRKNFELWGVDVQAKLPLPLNNVRIVEYTAG